jgi:RNA polymerase sigma factor (sigma-70 family)
MRVHESVVLGARLGSREDFDAIVMAYEGPLYGYAVSELGRGEAEDALQETLLKAFLGIARLRDSDRFEAWLYSVARNEIRSRRRRRAFQPEIVEVDPQSLPSPESAGEEGRELASLLPTLPPEQSAILRLRFWTDLSLREIALVEGIPEALAKSRLYEARKALRRAAAEALSRGAPAALAPRKGPPIPPGLEELVMDKLESYRNAGAVFERLGLAEQAEIARAARRGERWPESVLSALGRTEGGAELVRDFDARFRMGELAEIVNRCDHFTERRLVLELERLDPETAEEIKKSMFVFEDFSLLDERALRALFGEVEREVLALGLSGVERRLRDLILSRLPEGERGLVERAIEDCDPAPERVRAAQEKAIAWAYCAEKAGRLRRLEQEGRPKGSPLLTLA